MKRVLIGALLFLSGTLAGAFYQARTVQAQELLGNMGDFIGIEQQYTAALVNGDEGTLTQFWHESYLGWPTGEDLPWDKKFGIKTLSPWREDHGGTLMQPMLEPIANRVLDDEAVIHYFLEYIVQAEDGTKSNRKLRVSHFWVKSEGAWKLLGEAMAPE